MKNCALAALMSIAFIAAHGKQPTNEQVEQYLIVTKTKESAEGQVEGFSKQYAKTSSPKELEQINLYLNSVMGWPAVKNEYIKLVQETYSDEEISASLNFMKSAVGRSIARKNLLFSSKASTLIAKRVQAFSQNSAKFEQQDSGEESQSTEALEAADLERHQVSDRTYFTGRVINKGKATARSIQVEINLFLGSKFVDQYTAYISGAIPAGGERYFKVSCGCKDSSPAQHDSFRASVVSVY